MHRKLFFDDDLHEKMKRRINIHHFGSFQEKLIFDLFGQFLGLLFEVHLS